MMSELSEAEEFIFKGKFNVCLFEFILYSIIDVRERYLLPTSHPQRSIDEIVRSTLDLVCASFHDATLAHSEHMDPAELASLVQILRDGLNLNVSMLVSFLTGKSASELQFAQHSADCCVADMMRESAARQTPIAEAISVATSSLSSGFARGQAMDALSELFGREVIFRG